MKGRAHYIGAVFWGLFLFGCTERNPVADGEGDSGVVAGDSGVVSGDSGVVAGDSGVVSDDGAASGTRFSFFVTSLASLQKLSGSQSGFGGDLRHGETGAGAGLRGADKICAAIAELSLKGSSAKKWRAFLSVSDDGSGKQVNAIDRVGSGPWYDRLGRVVAKTPSDLLNTRPNNADPAIANDLPNEFGVPNHQPDPTQGQVDNHHMLTGTGSDGKLYSASTTCKDWTGKTGSEGKPRCGFAWPRRVGGGGKGGGSHWMTTHSAPGCAPGVDILSHGGSKPGDNTVGGGGGYGGFYCFALVP